jgi:hypothetical protein
MNNNNQSKPRRRTSRSNSSAARLNSATVNSDLSLIKGAKSSKPPSIITTRKNEESTTMSRSPLFSQLHWMMNDMSPRNSSPRTSSPSNSPRSYTPTKRSYLDTFAFDNHKSRTEEITPVGTSSFTPSIITGDDTNGTFSRSVRQRRDEESFLSTSLPVNANIVTNTTNTFVASFDKMLSPPSPTSYGQFPLFGHENAELDINGESVQFDTSDTHNPQFFTSLQKPSVQNNAQFSFSLPEFKLSTDSSMVLSEPSMFDFDSL